DKPADLAGRNVTAAAFRGCSSSLRNRNIRHDCARHLCHRPNVVREASNGIRRCSLTQKWPRGCLTGNPSPKANIIDGPVRYSSSEPVRISGFSSVCVRHGGVLRTCQGLSRLTEGRTGRRLFLHPVGLCTDPCVQGPCSSTTVLGKLHSGSCGPTVSVAPCDARRPSILQHLVP